MARVALVLGAAALLVGGCRALPVGFACTETSQCERAGEKGRCEADTGYCSFPDPTCGRGWRYGDLAGQGLGGTCVGEVTDGGGLPDAPEDGPADGAPDVGPPPDGADGPAPDDAPVQGDAPQTDAPQSDGGWCCETCYDTCYAKCYDTCYDTCYEKCCIYYWDTTDLACYGAGADYRCVQADLDHNCNAGANEIYDCGSGSACNPHQCNPHDCNPSTCTLADCNCSPTSCGSYQCNPRQCNCHDC